jgi:hypothetical protein
VLVAVSEETGEGREVDAVGFEVEGLDAGDWLPEEGIDAAGIDPRGDRRYSSSFAVDADFGLAEGGVAAGFELVCDGAGDAEIPELVADLALRDDVEEDLLDVAREVEGGAGLVGSGVEGDGAVAGADGDDDVRRDWRGGVPGGGVELECGTGEDDAGKGRVDDVADGGEAGLRRFEERGEVGDVALDVPGGAEGGAGFGGGAVEDVGVAEIEPGAAVELAPGSDGEVGGEDNLGPGAGAGGGRRVGEGRAVEVFKGGVAEQRDDAGFGGGTWDEGLGGDWVRRAYLRSCWGGDDLRRGGGEGEGCEEEELRDGGEDSVDAREGGCFVHGLHSLGFTGRGAAGARYHILITAE